MKQFAKLFDTKEHGQILALNHQDADGSPAIIVMFDPGIEGLGVASVVLGFDEEADRDVGFAALNEETLRRIVAQQIQGIRGLFKK